MDSKKFEEFIGPIICNIDRTIDNVTKRGYDDIDEDFDDYQLLIEKFEFRKLITFELYENYFLPKRHEFELQILNDIVDAVAKYQPWSYLGGAALSGVIGNTVYDLLRKLIAHVSDKFKGRGRKRSKAFMVIKSDIDKIEEYFKTHKTGKIEKLEKALKIDRGRLVPLLKLLGFKHYSKKKKGLWVKQD